MWRGGYRGRGVASGASPDVHIVSGPGPNITLNGVLSGEFAKERKTL